MLNGFHQTDGVLTQPNEHHFDEQRGNSLPVEHFDYTGMDSIEDRAREALEVKGGIEKLVAELAEEFADDRASCAIGKLVCLIADHHEPKLAIACLALTAGMNTDDGIGGASSAAVRDWMYAEIIKHGFSFSQQGGWHTILGFGAKRDLESEGMKSLPQKR